MNHDILAKCSRDLAEDSILGAGDDDVANLLQLDLDFAVLDDQQTGYPGLDNSLSDLGMPQLDMNLTLQGSKDSDTHLRPTSLQTQNQTSKTPFVNALVNANPIPMAVPFFSQEQFQPLVNQDQAHYPQRKCPRPREGRQNVAPPTPQSLELHPAARIFRNLNGENFSGLPKSHANRDELALFTPLASPAVTPLDPSLRIPDTDPVLPSGYFSPLTSPAMEARKNHTSRKAPVGDVPATDFSGARSSPSEAISGQPTISNASRITHRPTSRRPSDTVIYSNRTPRQSPLSKPQCSRKRGTIPTSPSRPTDSDTCGNMASASASYSIPRFQGSSSLVTSENSSQNSISPEPLPEVMMPPPSVPRPVFKSPDPNGRNRRPASASKPATPATLMRLPTQGPTKALGQPAMGVIDKKRDDSMEEIVLPEAAASFSPEVACTEPNGFPIDEEVVRNISAKTPKLSASSTPGSLSNKPRRKSQADVQRKRSESRPVTGPQLRTATTSSQVSPAIRPKISPNIKPLVSSSNLAPSSGSADTSALYLASKSNYQNILEGTHLPGVSYPENLAENLSSRRTSHKLAEQGRRNRINVALKEMESLLPSYPPAKCKKENSSSGEGDAVERSANPNNSKASTVELAIAYIKALQTELSDTRMKLEDQEKRLAETTSTTHATMTQPTTQM